MTPKEIFDKNQKLVGWCFKKYVREYTASDFEDILQEGMLGLWQAAKRYDESKGVEFSTFAVYYILGNMKKYMKERRNIIRVPHSAYKNKDVNLIYNLSHIISIDAEITQSDGSSTRLSDLIEDNPDEYDFITENLVETFITTNVNSRHKDMMREYYYGCIRHDIPTQMELSEKYKHTQPYISRIINKYNTKFKKYIHSTESAGVNL